MLTRLELASGYMPVLVPPQLITFFEGITAPHHCLGVGSALPCVCSALPLPAALSCSRAGSPVPTWGPYQEEQASLFQDSVSYHLAGLIKPVHMFVGLLRKKPEDTCRACL